MIDDSSFSVLFAFTSHHNCRHDFTSLMLKKRISKQYESHRQHPDGIKTKYIMHTLYSGEATQNVVVDQYMPVHTSLHCRCLANELYLLLSGFSSDRPSWMM